MTSVGLTCYSLWKREVVRFLRQRSRVTGSLLQPVVFWLLFGFGFGQSFRSDSAPEGMDFLEYYFPGTIALIVLFTSIFASISLIEDRNEGFLQSVLVAPVPRLAIVFGKVLGGATLAVLNGVVFALLGPLAGVPFALVPFLALLGVMVLVAIGLSGLGFFFAWRTDSTSGFHAIMSVVLFPLWLLSGAFFPVTGVPAVLSWLMAINPLTYGIALMRHALYGADAGAGLPSVWLSLAGTVTFAVVVLLLSAWQMRKKLE